MALRRRGDVLVAVVDHPDRLARGPRQQRRMDGQDRRVLLLATEAAAGLRLDDLRAGVVETERPLERPMDVVRALERAVDGHPAVRPRHRDHRVVLDVQLLLVAHPVLALDDDVGGGHRGIDLAALDRVAGEHVGALERVEHRVQLLGARLEAATRLAQGRPVRGGDEGDRLRVVADLAADRDEDRLILLDEADDVRAGDVGRRDDDDRIPVEPLFAVDGDEARVGVLAPDRRAVPGAGEHEVVRVQGDARELGRALAAERSGRPGTAGDDRIRGHDERRRPGRGRRRSGGRARRRAGRGGTFRQAVGHRTGRSAGARHEAGHSSMPSSVAVVVQATMPPAHRAVKGRAWPGRARPGSADDGRATRPRPTRPRRGLGRRGRPGRRRRRRGGP